MTAEQAKQRGYWALTAGYTHTPSQDAMLDNVLADMIRGAIDHVVVSLPDKSREVWRRGGV